MLEKILHMRHVQFITIIIKKDQRYLWKASNEEVKELKEEGINTEIVPWVNEKDN